MEKVIVLFGKDHFNSWEEAKRAPGKGPPVQLGKKTIVLFKKTKKLVLLELSCWGKKNDSSSDLRFGQPVPLTNARISGGRLLAREYYKKNINFFLHF